MHCACEFGSCLVNNFSSGPFLLYMYTVMSFVVVSLQCSSKCSMKFRQETEYYMQQIELKMSGNAIKFNFFRCKQFILSPVYKQLFIL